MNCETCKYSESFSDPAQLGVVQMRCLRFPPVPMMTSSKTQGMSMFITAFPTVQATTRCGEYEPKLVV